MKKVFFLFFLALHYALSAGIPITEPYLGPTETLIKRDSRQVVQQSLSKQGINNDMLKYLDTVAKNESWGHVGYHGATQHYRVYQDIIRFTVEEILGKTVPKDFHFFRVPGDRDLNLFSIDEFFTYWDKDVNNRDEIRSKQLLSLNFSIYSNYENPGSCSAYYFAKGKSASSVDYVKMLEPFFKNLGIDKGRDRLNDLFAIADKWLNKKTGILLQISENSHHEFQDKEAYNFADSHCYPAVRGGFLYDTNLISFHYQTMMTDSYVNKDSEVAPQLRLLIDNRYTLNPYSNLVVKRWDLNDKEKVAKYETEMRKYIRNLKDKTDSKKVKNYKAKLEW